MSENIFKQIGKYVLNNGKSFLFFLVCWYFGIKTFNLGYANIDLSKPDEIKPIFLAFSVIGILLILLPFVKRMKIGDFEVEREIEQAKKDLNEFKNETRNTISMMSTQITTVASIRNQNQVTVYVPGYEEANSELKQRTSQSVERKAEEIKDEFLENQDTAMAVLKLRVQLEYLLRKLLEERYSLNNASINTKSMSLLQMSRMFFEYYPNYRYLQKSFDYVREVGNAAAHAQKIPDFQAQEALDIGAKLIATLQSIAHEEGLI